jgi:hypothetical protein
MKNSNTFSDAEVTQIDQRIGQSFAFMRDVLDDPSLLDEIPSGSTLAFRDIVLLRDYVRLTVFRPATSTADWRVFHVRGTLFHGNSASRHGTPPMTHSTRSNPSCAAR